MPFSCNRLPVIAFLLAGALPAAAAVPDGFENQLVRTNFTNLVSLDFLPDGRCLLIEHKNARIRMLLANLTTLRNVLTIPEVEIEGTEKGLNGIVVDPQWPVRPYVYVHFDRVGDVISISRYTATGDLSDGFSTDFNLGDRYDIINDVVDVTREHNGGTLRFGPDGMLYASIGEDGSGCFAADSTDLRGTILRIDTGALPDTGTGPPPRSLITPADNPYQTGDPNADLVFAMGVRNPFRFSIDPVTGKLYAGDVGLATYEELNEVSGGENFGWPFREGPYVRTENGCTEPGGSGTQGYVAPIGGWETDEFTPASVIAGPRYRPVPGGAFSFPAEYDGALLYADFYSGFQRWLVEDGGSWAPLDSVPGQPNATDWGTDGQFMADYLTGPDGAIYFVDWYWGHLRRLVWTGLLDAGEPTLARPFLGAAPNPASLASGPEVRVGFEMPEPGRARVEVYDVAGHRVRVLFEGERPQGPSELDWNGRDDAGRKVGPGVYFLRLDSAASRASRRVILLP